MELFLHLEVGYCLLPFREDLLLHPDMSLNQNPYHLGAFALWFDSPVLAEIVGEILDALVYELLGFLRMK